MIATRDELLGWLIERADRLALFSGPGGVRTRAMEVHRQNGWEVDVNMRHPCTNQNRSAGVLIRRFGGEECCEWFSWKELEREHEAAKGKRAYEEFRAHEVAKGRTS